MDHMSTAGACVHSYTGILSEHNDEIEGQVLPTTTQLLSEEDRMRMTKFYSPFAICYISKNGDRQRPSMSESTLAFAASCVRKTRAEFARQMVNLRRQQQEARVKGLDLKDCPLRDWTAPVKWGGVPVRSVPMHNVRLLCLQPFADRDCIVLAMPKEKQGCSLIASA